ncbi:hypothetical protein A6R68_15796 [Neotoma lepida]|uniref:PLAT domain-containing protein n=1 Tax=Neotoma lepida TaxID=56216 RepID=A0A1A6H746_NEOLE|nr:hypothetical protein A6R68_15796 [Neotoma lepida]
MPSYTVTVATGSQWFAGTDDYIYLSLIGSAGCSEKHLLDKAFYNDFERGANGCPVFIHPNLPDVIPSHPKTILSSLSTPQESHFP